jgi:hypothetical protein
MKMHEMFPSNYSKKEEFLTPRVCIIAGVGQEELKDGDTTETKNILHFKGDGIKPLVLNKINALTIAELYGDDSDNWNGKPIEVYADHSIMMAGKKVGGIRLRAPSRNGYQPPAPAAYSPLQLNELDTALALDPSPEDLTILLNRAAKIPQPDRDAAYAKIGTFKDAAGLVYDRMAKAFYRPAPVQEDPNDIPF